MTSAAVLVEDYSGLQTYVTNAIRRPLDIDKAPTWIAIAEARLNRELGPVESDVPLTGVAASRSIDISALTMTMPVALFLAEANCDEIEVKFKADGTFPYLTSSGRPGFAAIDNTNIDFDRPLDQAYPFRFRYQGRFALTDASPTNWLLTNHPDLYIAATIMWGYGYREQFGNASVWKTILDEGIPSVKSIIAQSKRGVLSVDKGLRSYGRRTYLDLVNNG